MENLKNTEIVEVSGGNPLLSVGVGVIGTYAYESVGGKEGIDTYLTNSYESAKSSIRHWKKRFEDFFE
ncbi:hypothetical protein D210916BOD24_20100 [Alteromonas sp. D210916BOD_24]|uniref:hypothetical protein n=1 Tax=Alteromonas sp. D210916BOD_24 TaxID=3157618 RepID=UPI00399CA1BE